MVPKGFVKKKVMINGHMNDMILPVSGLDKWKHLIVE